MVIEIRKGLPLGKTRRVHVEISGVIEIGYILFEVVIK